MSTVITQVTDKVSGKVLHTNNAQLERKATKLGITVSELVNSYVGQEGRTILQQNNHTVESAVKEYSLNLVVAQNLRCLRVKPEPQRRGRKPKAAVQPANEEAPASVNEPNSDGEDVMIKQLD